MQINNKTMDVKWTQSNYKRPPMLNITLQQEFLQTTPSIKAPTYHLNQGSNSSFKTSNLSKKNVQ